MAWNRFRNNLKGRVKRHLTRWPRLYLFLNRLRARFRFADERRLASGRLRPSSDHPSAVYFTTFKCASVFLADQLRRLTTPAGLRQIDFDAYFAYRSRSLYRLYEDPGFCERAFHAHGFLYGPIRRYRAIPQIDRYRVLLVLRDPRDALTSHYFSAAFSHGLINEDVWVARKRALASTIDDYVLDLAEQYRSTYEEYVRELLGRGNVLFIKYEDMIADYPRVLRRIASHLDVAEHTNLITRLIEEADFSVKGEDRYRHKRSVQAGDHKRKLRDATVARLNDMFSDCLRQLGYRDTRPSESHDNGGTASTPRPIEGS